MFPTIRYQTLDVFYRLYTESLPYSPCTLPTYTIYSSLYAVRDVSHTSLCQTSVITFI